MIHRAIAEKKNPKTELDKFLTNYRNTPHNTTGQYPSMLLMNRVIRTKVPAVIKALTSKVHNETSIADRKKEQQKR